MILRPASMDDAGLLLAWRNDSLTREASINSDPIGEAQHQAWLAEVMADPARTILIALCDDEPVGMVRIDREGALSELSWTVSPDHRGKGHGTKLVQLGVAQAGGLVEAVIKQENIASQKIAAAAGLSFARHDGTLTIWSNAPA